MASVTNTHAPHPYDSPSLTKWRNRTQGWMSAIAIGSLPILVLELERDRLPASDQLLIDLVNIVVLIAFAVDYAVGLVLARERRDFVRGEWLELLLVVSQAMVLFPSLAAFGLFRAVRGLRLVRVAAAVGRVVAIGGLASREGRRVLRERATSFALGLAAMTWVSGAVAFTLAEDVGVDGRLSSFFDALWWSLATITTVGYGDIFPVTAAGRIVGGFTMVIGISVFAIITAKIAEFFTRETGDTGADVVDAAVDAAAVEA